MINDKNIWNKIKNGELDDNIFLRPLKKNVGTINIMKEILFEKYK